MNSRLEISEIAALLAGLNQDSPERDFTNLSLQFLQFRDQETHAIVLDVSIQTLVTQNLNSEIELSNKIELVRFLPEELVELYINAETKKDKDTILNYLKKDMEALKKLILKTHDELSQKQILDLLSIDYAVQVFQETDDTALQQLTVKRIARFITNIKSVNGIEVDSNSYDALVELVDLIGKSNSELNKVIGNQVGQKVGFSGLISFLEKINSLSLDQNIVFEVSEAVINAYENNFTKQELVELSKYFQEGKLPKVFIDRISYGHSSMFSSLFEIVEVPIQKLLIEYLAPWSVLQLIDGLPDELQLPAFRTVIEDRFLSYSQIARAIRRSEDPKNYYEELIANVGDRSHAYVIIELYKKSSKQDRTQWPYLTFEEIIQGYANGTIDVNEYRDVVKMLARKAIEAKHPNVPSGNDAVQQGASQAR